MFRRTKEEEGQRRELTGFSAVLLCLLFTGFACADTVTLDLFSIGCPTEFGTYWQANFDLGVTFSQINHVYIDWSGEITAGLAQSYDDDYQLIGEPSPIDVGIYASLGWPRRFEIWGGEEEYPMPYIFSSQDEIPVGLTNWTDLLDGQGTVLIDYTEPILIGASIVEHGSVTFSKATLVIDGTVVPEPSTFLLIAFGAIGPRLIRNSRHNKNRVL